MPTLSIVQLWRKRIKLDPVWQNFTQLNELKKARCNVCHEVMRIMAAVHRVLLKPMEVHAANADRIIKACLCLCNFRIAHGLLQDLAKEWRQEVDPLPQAGLGYVASSMSGKDLQETLTNYYTQEGKVEWQERLLGSPSSGTEDNG